VETLLEYGLIAVFVALMLTPFGLPIPEDISLLAAGALAHMGHAELHQAIIVGYVGVIGSDVISWTMGRKIGLKPTGFIARIVGQSDIERIERFYRRWGAFAIVIARNFPGMRAPAFFFAGASGVSLPRFLAYDGAAACITVGVFTTLGYLFVEDLTRVITWLDRFRYFGTTMVLALIVFGIWRVVKRFRRRSSPPSD
jgi:membrane protein DedA with SNARE-associated domain